MEKSPEINAKTSPKLTMNPDLEKYRGQVLFPEKLQKANEMLKRTKLPPNKNSHLETVDSNNTKSKD